MPSPVLSGGARTTSLQEFVAGPENCLAPVAVADLLSANLGDQPLVLYGPTGIGKTLLSLGMAARWQQQHEESTPLVTTGADYVREFGDAARRYAVRPFSSRLVDAPLLVIDDLDPLIDRLPAQEQLNSILDQRSIKARPTIITMRRAPAAPGRLQPTLASRLSAGLVVPLSMPGEAARRVILLRLAELLGVDLPERVAQHLAAALAVPATQLRGALLELAILAKGANQPINEELANTLLARLLGNRPTIRQIASATSRYLGVKLAELRGPTRRQSVVRARGIAMLLCRELTEDSLSQIGSHFGGRDHTTVMHACRKTDQLRKTDAAVRTSLSELRSLLGAH